MTSPRSSRKGIPTNMVLAQFPTDLHRLRLLLHRRHSERVCAVPAPRASTSFPLYSCFRHIFSHPVQDLSVRRHRREFSHLAVLCVANSVWEGKPSGIWNRLVRRLPP